MVGADHQAELFRTYLVSLFSLLFFFLFFIGRGTRGYIVLVGVHVRPTTSFLCGAPLILPSDDNNWVIRNRPGNQVSGSRVRGSQLETTARQALTGYPGERHCLGFGSYLNKR